MNDKNKSDSPVQTLTLEVGVADFMQWPWPQIEPYFKDLEKRTLTAETVDDWLAGWTRLDDLLSERSRRLEVAKTVDTTDKRAEQNYNEFLEEILPPCQKADQDLKNKLLKSGLAPEGLTIALRNMKADAELFRERNLPLLVKERQQASQYDKIIGAQTVVWSGGEITLAQLGPVYQDPDRETRRRAWRLAAERQLADREAINQIWRELMKLRGRIAAQADQPDYRAYRWLDQNRFDYTPKDCLTFHDSIAQVAAPAAGRLYQRRKQRLGVETLRPWDLNVDPRGRPALKPFTKATELISGAQAIFNRVDPELGRYFQIMDEENLLDLENRKGKAPGGYCTEFAVAGRPFIFMNAVGLHQDVQTILHEAGHCFHTFETHRLPYHQQRAVPLEFAEVASMSMELIAAPYLEKTFGGYYEKEEADRARLEHLEQIILFWPYMAVVDAFQHWVYKNHETATDPAACDQTWSELWDRFMPSIDYDGFEEIKKTGWQRKLHIFHIPFYYVEYGLAQLGAVQVWKNYLANGDQAVSDYRRALALGGTADLPGLFAAAGARFAFDARTLGEAVTLVEAAIDRLSE